MTGPRPKSALVGLMATFGRLWALCTVRKSADTPTDREEVAACGQPADLIGGPTLAEILSDPIVQALMAADSVDPKALEGELRTMSRLIAEVRCGRLQPSAQAAADLSLMTTAICCDHISNASRTSFS